MYSGGENLQMNGDTPHDGGHGGGGHGDCEELQRTGRSVTPAVLPLPEPSTPVHCLCRLYRLRWDPKMYPGGFKCPE